MFSTCNTEIPVTVCADVQVDACHLFPFMGYCWFSRGEIRLLIIKMSLGLHQGMYLRKNRDSIHPVHLHNLRELDKLGRISVIFIRTTPFVTSCLQKKSL